MNTLESGDIALDPQTSSSVSRHQSGSIDNGLHPRTSIQCLETSLWIARRPSGVFNIRLDRQTSDCIPGHPFSVWRHRSGSPDIHPAPSMSAWMDRQQIGSLDIDSMSGDIGLDLQTFIHCLANQAGSLDVRPASGDSGWISTHQVSVWRHEPGSLGADPPAISPSRRPQNLRPSPVLGP